jgi:type II secretory pathway component PulJ
MGRTVLIVILALCLFFVLLAVGVVVRMRVRRRASEVLTGRAAAIAEAQRQVRALRRETEKQRKPVFGTGGGSGASEVQWDGGGDAGGDGI